MGQVSKEGNDAKSNQRTMYSGDDPKFTQPSIDLEQIGRAQKLKQDSSGMADGLSFILTLLFNLWFRFILTVHGCVVEANEQRTLQRCVKIKKARLIEPEMKNSQ